MTMTKLSPAAQAILDAYQFAPIEDELTAAAVLRAAADQVTPITWTVADSCCDVKTALIRISLLAIAAELEAR